MHALVVNYIYGARRMEELKLRNPSGIAKLTGVALSCRDLSHRLVRRGVAEPRQPSPCLRCSHPWPCLRHGSENVNGSRVDQRDVRRGARCPGMVHVARPAGLINISADQNYINVLLIVLTLCLIYLCPSICRPLCSRSSRTRCL